MAVGLAQPSALFFDIADQQIGNRHAGVWRFGLVADHDDVGRGIGAAQCLGGDNAGRTIADNHVFHGSSS